MHHVKKPQVRAAALVFILFFWYRDPEVHRYIIHTETLAWEIWWEKWGYIAGNYGALFQLFQVHAWDFRLILSLYMEILDLSYLFIWRFKTYLISLYGDVRLISLCWDFGIIIGISYSLCTVFSVVYSKQCLFFRKFWKSWQPAWSWDLRLYILLAN